MAKHKIICFVRNEARGDVGLLKVFAYNKVIIINDPFCVHFLNNNGAVLLGENEKKYISISSQEVTLSDRPSSEWDILFVHDSISVKALSEAYPNIFKDSIVLYHKNASWKNGLTTDDDEAMLKGLPIKCSVQGQHEPRDKYYPILTEIPRVYKPLESGKFGFEKSEYEKALNTIFNTLYKEKLEIVLNFLHSCLEKKPGEADFDKLQEELKEADITTQKIEDAKISSILSGTYLDDEYMESLGLLRDTLLGIVMKKG